MNGYDIAQELLTAAASMLGATAPDRQYVTVGQPTDVVWDGCDQLVVVVSSLNPSSGLFSQPGQVKGVVIPLLSLAVEVVRCFPMMDESGNPPSEADLNSAAETLLIDQKNLFCGITDEIRAGSLFSDTHCDHDRLLSVEMVGPSGGMASVRATLEHSMSCGDEGS